MSEADLITEFFAPLARYPGAFGLRDDAALIEVPPGGLVLTADALVAGVHFLPNDPPDSIGHKALAVNLSDLAAKGARPFGYLMTLSLPGSPDRVWLRDFVTGLGALQDEAGIALLGGDTTATPGPLSVSITALGVTPNGEMVMRRGGRPGDTIYVTGTIGDAALGLGILRDAAQASKWAVNEDAARFLAERYRRPTPRIAAAETVRRHAAASIDISDGLVGDLDRLCDASQTGAVIQARRVPLSSQAARACQAQPGLIADLLTGGDDYELLLAVHPDEANAFEAGLASASVPFAAIGRLVEPEHGVIVLDDSGVPMRFARRAYDHFG